LAALADKAVAVVAEALDGYAEPGELKAAVEVVKFLKLTEPGPARPTTPAAAEREIMEREHTEMLDELLTPMPPSWKLDDNGYDDEEEE
jgi:hypothetical protein